MATNSVSTVLKKLAWTAGIVLFLALAAHILLPYVVNTSVLRLRILAQVAERVGGEVDFRTLSPALLPLPHVTVIQGRADRSGVFSVRFSKSIVYPRIWPLLAGRLRIGRLKVLEPEIVIPVSTERLSSRQPSPDRSIADLGPEVRAALKAVTGELSPLVVRIHGGSLTLNNAAGLPLTFTEIRMKARVSDQEVELWIKGRSNLMQAFEVDARLAVDSLDGNGRIQISGLDAASLTALGLVSRQTPLPEMQGDLSVKFETRGLDSFHCEYKVQTPRIVLRNGSRRLAVRDISLKGEGRGSARKLQLSILQLQTASPAILLSGAATWSGAHGFLRVPDEITLNAVNLDVAPIREGAQELAGHQPTVRQLFEIIQAGRIPELEVKVSGIGDRAPASGADVIIRGRLSEGLIVLPHDLLKLEQVDGRVVVDKGRLAAQDVSARLGNSLAKAGTLVLGLYDGTRDFSLDTAIDADIAEVPGVLKKLLSSPEIVDRLDALPPAKGRIVGRLRVGDRLDNISVKTSGSGRISALDASLAISGDIDARPSASPDFRLSAQGALGPRLLAWLQDRGSIPADFSPMAPVTVVQARITSNGTEGLAGEGRLALPGGLKIMAGLQIDPDESLSGSLHLQDAESDAAIDYQHTPRAGVWQAGFSGNLVKASVDKLLRRNALILGWLKGDLRIRLEEGAQQHNTVQGRLDFSQINMPAGFPIPLSLLSGQVAGNGARFDLFPTLLKLDDVTARLSGNGTFADKALRMDLALDAQNLDADKILQVMKREQKPSEQRRTNPLAMHPISGKARIHAGQMTVGGYRFTPFQAVAAFDDEQVSMDLVDVGFCSISIPGQIRFDQDGVWLRLKPHAADSPLQDTGLCLTGTSITERLAGTVSVDGRIESRAQYGEELIQHLEGALDVKITEGRVFNAGAAGFFTNLLAFISVNRLIDGAMPDLRRTDFQYKSMTSKLVFKEGVMHIEEGVLRSNSVNIVASGDYGMATKKINLVLLVSPLTTVDWIVERIPLLGNILQGTLVAIPVGVKGPAADPTVVPLSPTAVGSRLGGILKRTLKTPFRILSPLLEEKPSSEEDS